MNAQLLRSCLITLLALVPAAAAQTQHRGPDVDVFEPVAQMTGSKGVVRYFDADWTADGRLAMAFSEYAGWYPSTHSYYDRVVIALREPGQGTRVLGVFETPGWRVEHVSVAVPDEMYGTEDLDRVFVAITAFMGVAGTKENEGTHYGFIEQVRVVRLLSVPLDAAKPEITLALPPNHAKPGASPDGAPMPDAEVSVGRYELTYVVDVAFVDPYTTTEGGGHIMLSRSFDAGKSLGDAFYVTGPCSQIAAKDPKSPLVNSLFDNPSLAWDESGMNTVLAIEDVVDGVVHLVSGDPADKAFGLEFSTPDGDLRAERAPRVAALEGRVNFTCLAGEKDSDGARSLTWYTGILGLPSSFQELLPLLPQALTRADIEVNGSKGLIAVIGLDDAGEKRAFWIEANRSLTSSIPSVEVVDDDQDHDPGFDRVDGEACSARTPHGAQADRRTPLFKVRGTTWGDSTVRMDP